MGRKFNALGATLLALATGCPSATSRIKIDPDVRMDPMITTIAGVYAGTVKVTKVEEGVYFAEGDYSRARHPRAFSKAFRNADKNKDGVVTRREAIDLARRLYPRYARKKH